MVLHLELILIPKSPRHKAIPPQPVVVITCRLSLHQYANLTLKAILILGVKSSSLNSLSLAHNEKHNFVHVIARQCLLCPPLTVTARLLVDEKQAVLDPRRILPSYEWADDTDRVDELNFAEDDMACRATNNRTLRNRKTDIRNCPRLNEH